MKLYIKIFFVIFSMSYSLYVLSENQENEYSKGSCDTSAVIVLLDTILGQLEQGCTFTAESCCALIESDFNGTFTELANINENVLDTIMILAGGFSLTLDAIDSCCNTLKDDFQATWTVLASLVPDDASCEHVTITTPTTITVSGAYCLGKSINGSITVAAHNVILDLNENTISNGQIVVDNNNNIVIRNGILDSGAVGIAALAVTNCSNVMVNNLIIRNSFVGIQCGQSTNVAIKDVVISDALNYGIHISATTTALSIENFEIINCVLEGINFAANVQGCTLVNGHVSFTNGIRAAGGTFMNNIKFRDLFIEKTPSSSFPITFLGTSSTVYCNNVHIADASQGMQFTNISQSLIEHCVVKNISAPSLTPSSAFRIDNGTNNKFENCTVTGMTASGSSTLDGFRIVNANNCIIKNSTVEGLAASSGVANALNIVTGQRISIERCTIENITSSAQADGLHIQTTNNVIVTDCIVNGCNANGYYLNGGTNATYMNCIASNCTADGFRSLVTTNVLYHYCYSQNNNGAGFNISNAICGNCESARNVGVGFNGNSTSTAYNCFSGLNTGSDYTAITSSVQALGAGSPKVGYSISI